MGRALAAAIVGFLVVIAAGLPAAAQPAVGNSPPPAGDHRLIVGILDIRTEGLPQSAANEFERQLEELSRDAGQDEFWLGTRSRMDEILAGSAQWMGRGCLLGPCMQVVRQQTRAALVMTVFLQNLGMTYRYVITVIRTDTGDVVDQRIEACGACTQNEAINKATLAALDALTTAPAKLAAATGAVELHLAPIKARLGKARRRTRTAALVLVGLAAVSGGLGAYWMSKDRDDVARPAMGVGAGLAAAGVLTFAVSLTWD